jgi:RNA polymerase sigma-70 factor (ECF subfamily)
MFRAGTENVLTPQLMEGGSALPFEQPECDRDLVGLLKARDERAFETIVHRYTGRMLAAARRLLGNEHDAQDAVQQAFISAFRAIPAFNAKSRLSTWLHKIVINAALAQLRSQRRRGSESSIGSLGMKSGGTERWGEENSCAIGEGEYTFAGRDACEIVRTCIDKLPASYRSVLLLRDIQELGTEEVAERLAISANAAKIRLHRARRALKTLVQQEQARTY